MSESHITDEQVLADLRAQLNACPATLQGYRDAAAFRLQIAAIKHRAEKRP